MRHLIEELGAIVDRHPDACVLMFKSDCPGSTIIFDTWGPETFGKEEEARECNKYLAPRSAGIEALFQPDGTFDYMSAKAALNWFADNETPWKVANMNEYGVFAYIIQAPNRAIQAFKARVDSLRYE